MTPDANVDELRNKINESLKQFVDLRLGTDVSREVVARAIAAVLVQHVATAWHVEVEEPEFNAILDSTTPDNKFAFRVAVIRHPLSKPVVPVACKPQCSPVNEHQLDVALNVLVEHPDVLNVYAFKNPDGTLGAIGDPATGGCQILVELTPDAVARACEPKTGGVVVDSIIAAIGWTFRKGLLWFLIVPEGEQGNTPRILKSYYDRGMVLFKSKQ